MDRDIKFKIKASSDEIYAYEEFEICVIIESLYVEFLNVKLYCEEFKDIQFVDDSLIINDIGFKDFNIKKGIHLNKVLNTMEKNEKFEVRFKARIITENNNISYTSLLFKLVYEYMKGNIRTIGEVLSNEYVLKIKCNELQSEVFCDREKVGKNQEIAYMCKVKYKGNIKSLIKVYIHIPKNTVLVGGSLKINGANIKENSWNDGFKVGETEEFYVQRNFSVNFSIRVTEFAERWDKVIPKVLFIQEIEKESTIDIRKYETKVPIVFYGYSAIKEFLSCGIFRCNASEEGVGEIHDYYGSLVVTNIKGYIGPKSIKDGLPYIVGAGIEVSGFILIKVTYSTKNIQAPIISEEFKLPFTEYIKSIRDNVNNTVVKGNVFDVFITEILENNIYVSVKSYIEAF